MRFFVLHILLLNLQTNTSHFGAWISLPGISIFYLSLFCIDTYIYGKTNYKQIFCLCVVLNKITFSPIKGRQVRLLVLFLISHTILSLLLTSHYIIFIVVVSNFPIRMAVVHLEFPSNKTNKVTQFLSPNRPILLFAKDVFISLYQLIFS